ncbi:MAG: 4-hydroxy-3-methylbut-2-enyl diphosphate reductase [Chloroflexi bacterium]|nr:4-hydroxy-3-methylbut-2-enyl diphosphate reductase [Chloroflexota bacterium]
MNKEIRKAQNIGLCFGVTCALQAVHEYAKDHKVIVTWGDVVHNSLVMDGLKQMGVQVVAAINDIKSSHIIIPAHGVSPNIIQAFNERRINIIDTTCPFVCRAQKTASAYGKKGFFTIVYGDKNHAEVKGILGWSGERSLATKDISELKKILNLPLKIGLLSQTTQKPSDFITFCQQVTELAYTKDSRIYITDTICHDIRKRQQAASELAQWADMVVVIGSPNSANTQNLLQLCSSITHAIQVEKAADLIADMVAGYQKIGVAAGASTDDAAINGVYEKLKSF